MLTQCELFSGIRELVLYFLPSYSEYDASKVQYTAVNSTYQEISDLRISEILTSILH